jgi:hypothetical protein
MTINLSNKYNLKDLDGMTLHTILTALADAQRMYKKAGLSGLADNATQAYKSLLSLTELSK